MSVIGCWGRTSVASTKERRISSKNDPLSPARWTFEKAKESCWSAVLGRLPGGDQFSPLEGAAGGGGSYTVHQIGESKHGA